LSKSVWEEIYEELRDQIISGKIPPGSTFPTNLELMKKYNVHSATIQSAVNALIRDGLILSQGKSAPRMVRSTPVRSKRKGGFSSEYGSKARKNILALKVVKQKKELPDSLQNELSPPVLFYHTEQFLNDLLVGISRSYVPHHPVIDELYKLMNQANASLYGSLEYLGYSPTTCEESLIADFATKQERKELQLPKSSNIPVVRVIRKVFDPNNHLIEYCFLTYRADCYEFFYRFNFQEGKSP
jgi:GntR family transcriptional regulator